MHVLRTSSLLVALALAGCDRLTGEFDQKVFDAEAIGYACRVSLKRPEDCMKENETQSPSSVLTGWKRANKDIEENVIDPSMGKDKPVVELTPSVPVPTEAEGAPTEAAPVAAPAHEAEPPKKPAKH